MNIHRKLFAIDLKNKSSKFQKIYFTDDVCLYYNQHILCSLKKQRVTIEFISVENDSIYIEGNVGTIFPKDEICVQVKLDDKIYDVELVDRRLQGIYSLNHLVKDYLGFKVEIPLRNIKKKSKLSVQLQVDNISVPVDMFFKKFAKLRNEWEESYLFIEKYLIEYNKDEKTLEISEKNLVNLIKKEYGFCKRLYSCKEEGAKKAVFGRLMYFWLKLFVRKEVWLFMDRVDKADDNAEHLFKYSMMKNDKIKKFFIIRKDVPDYQRLKKDYKIIPFGSFKHKLLHLMSSKIISSHVDEWVINPFMGTGKYYRDLSRSKFVFLQHGIVVSDVSGWLNKYNKGIDLLVTTSYLEHKSFLDCLYGYKDEVKLLGLPRYDNLNSNDKKQILIMPTWRKNIVKELNQVTGIRPYNEHFKKTDYFKRYNRLINDERFITAAMNNGYKIIFFPHPNIQQQIQDFNKHDNVIFADYHTSYQQLFNESSVLVTDFSSVHFDFAYLKKPVLYYQFDESHWGDGYFKYETMGFGEVCEYHDELIEHILNYINYDCEMKPKYVNRVDEFYAYTDKNNCLRVYNAIMELE